MRTKKSLKNMASQLIIRLVSTILSFACRTVFIYCLSEEYLGINSLLASVISILNLTELGIGASIIFALFKPVADGDTEKIKSLMDFYRRAYRVVGFVFLGVGTALCPVLPYLAKGGTDLVNLQVIYMLSIAEITVSYWFFAYKSAILSADQKEYTITLIATVVSFADTIIKILLLLLLRRTPAASFYAYTASGLVVKIVQNILVKNKVDSIYPFLKEKNIAPLRREDKTTIYKNVVGMATNKICWKLNDGIDSTVISALVGVSATGIYSNYLLIKTMIDNVMRALFGSLHSSVGNLCASETAEKKEQFFYTLNFTYFWLYGFCAICLWVLFAPFIAGVWLRNTKWLLSGWDEFLICLNFLIEGLAGAAVKYRDVNGLYWQTKYRYILSSALNIVLSVVLVGPAGMGVTGALLGTTVSLLVMLSYDPILVYREVFHKNAAGFYRLYLRNLLLIFGTGLILYGISLPFHAFTVGNFFIKMILCMVIPNVLWYLIFRKKPEFQYLRNTALGLLCRFLSREHPETAK